MSKRILSLLATIVILTLAAWIPARAQQQDQLTLSLSRDFGYSSGSGQIQGTFSMIARGPANLTKVDFLIDGKVIYEDTESPFKVQFNTDAYPLGMHTLSAVGYTSDGTEIKSKEFTREFVAASEGMKAAGRILVPILVIVLLIVGVTTVVPLVSGGRGLAKLAPGTPRNYPLGGAICPKCQRPFAMHIYGLNLLASRFDRCPYCGRWSLVRFKSNAELRAAEQAELERANEKPQVQGETEEEKLKKELDDSKYQGL